METTGRCEGCGRPVDAIRLGPQTPVICVRCGAREQRRRQIVEADGPGRLSLDAALADASRVTADPVTDEGTPDESFVREPKPGARVDAFGI